jgi:glycosyltransferase involved in cell wall biosynthesis
MILEETISDRISRLNVCVIIPTYNNSKTLERVINGVLELTSNVLVINDGSTDATFEILKKYSQISVINVSKNQGKGNALRIGFKKTKELKFDHAITIDSDGQHFPDDIPVFLDALEQETKDIILIGSRNMNQDNVPKKSSFGNKFSNFWFWFETGIQLEDTQSGFRLYPLNSIPNKFFTNKFEFEIEVIVRTAWKRIPVKNIPIKILYDPNERVTHFRPFQDFTRISILNTILVIITLFYIKPRNFIMSFKKKSFKEFVKQDVLASADSNSKMALSIALGVFIGIAPLWGFQTGLVLFLAVFLNLNKVLAFTFSNISFPPFIPFIIYGSLKIGAFFISNKQDIVFQKENVFEYIKINFTQYLIGSVVLATVTSIVFGFASYLLLSLFRKSSK